MNKTYMTIALMSPLVCTAAMGAKKAKAKGKRVLEDVEEPADTGRGSNVIDLMAALKASVDGKKKPPATAAKKPAAKKAPAKKTAARKRA